MNERVDVEEKQPTPYANPVTGNTLFPPFYIVLVGLGMALVLQGVVPQMLQVFGGGIEHNNTWYKINLILTQSIAFGGVAVLLSGGHNQLALKKITSPLWLLALGIAIFALPFIQYLALDAESFHLPAAFAELEKGLEDLEAKAHQTITRLLSEQLAFNLFVMGVIPGVMEELFFRGFIQKQLQKQLNPHGAICLTAFIFSLVHFQVYGFIPRMLLGAGYGYLTYWSGSLLPAMFAHFTNNAINVVVAYAALNGDLGTEWASESPPTISVFIALLSFGLTVFLMYLFYRYTIQQNTQYE